MNVDLFKPEFPPPPPIFWDIELTWVIVVVNQQVVVFSLWDNKVQTCVGLLGNKDVWFAAPIYGKTFIFSDFSLKPDPRDS